MPLSDRDYVRGKHPPNCTCKECTERRLGKLQSQSSNKSRRWTPRRIKPISVRSTMPPVFLKTIRGKPLHRIWREIPLSVHKLFLSLLVIAGLVDIIRRGYTLFTHQTDPIKNTIIFLVEVGLWFWIAAIIRSRRYRYSKPKFKLVLTTAIAVTLVCAFAGIEPLSSYKDTIFGSVSDYLEEQQTIREVAEKTAEEARIKVEKAAEEERIQAEALAIVEAQKKIVEEEAKAESAAITEEQTITNLGQLIHQSINMERTVHRLSLLQINSTLTSLAEEHSKEMANYDYFSHDRMLGSRDFDWGIADGAGRGENIFMMPEQLVIPGRILSAEELASEITRGWMESPGHRQNILSSQFTHTGIGIAKDGIYYYVTQIFEGQWY
ncbi:CAP domain-containing protein [Chloroflexota bacterium]